MSQVLKGKVIDAASGKGIKGVHVIEKEQNIGASTDAKGFFRIRSRSEKGVLHFSHVAYSSSEFSFSIGSIETQDALVIIKLEPGLELPETMIEAQPKPVVVFENKLRHVSDYQFIGNKILVLSYNSEKSFRSLDDYNRSILLDAVLYLIDDEKNIKDSLYLGKGEFSLNRTFRNTTLILNGSRVSEVTLENDKLEMEKLDREIYENFYAPTVDSLEHIYYVSTFDPTFPSFEYFAYDQRDSTYSRIKYICDDLGMELLRSEYKYMSGRQKVEAMNMSKRTGIDKKIIAAYMTGFHAKQYFEKPYAPLFLLNDTLMIFDHFNDHFYMINKWNSVIDSVKFDYHKKLKYADKYVPNKEWEGELFVDKEEKEIYTSFLRNGYCYLRGIDLNDGQLKDPFRLTYRYVEQLQLKNGYVYYVYRPYESSQKKYLYKERVY